MKACEWDEECALKVDLTYPNAIYVYGRIASLTEEIDWRFAHPSCPQEYFWLGPFFAYSKKKSTSDHGHPRIS